MRRLTVGIPGSVTLFELFLDLVWDGLWPEMPESKISRQFRPSLASEVVSLRIARRGPFEQ